MKVSYNGLWKILIDKNMNKKDLANACEIKPKGAEESLSAWMCYIVLEPN